MILQMKGWLLWERYLLEEAWDLLNEFNKDEFHLKHARIVEGIMKYLQRVRTWRRGFWGVVDYS